VNHCAAALDGDYPSERIIDIMLKIEGPKITAEKFRKAVDAFFGIITSVGKQVAKEDTLNALRPRVVRQGNPCTPRHNPGAAFATLCKLWRCNDSSPFRRES
jgi:hypothetical protein